MGQESCRKGEHVLLFTACLLAFLCASSACTPRTNAWIDNYYFGRAETMMARGDFDNAMEANAAILKEFPDTLGDQALYNMGLIYFHPENRFADDRKALDAFQRILLEYPKSPLKEETQMWILTIYEMWAKEKNVRDLNAAMAQLEEDLKEHRERTRRLQDSIREEREQTEEFHRKVAALSKHIEGLKAQVADLKARIEKLKKVDLRIEETKRKVLR